LGINIGQLAPYGPVRSTVVPRALNRAATKDDADAIEVQLEHVLADGALGVSFGPYEANSLASPEELVAAARVLARHERPFVVHRRDEGARAVSATQEFLSIQEQSGCQLEISHLKVAGKAHFHQFEDMLKRIETAQTRFDVGWDVYPYDASLTYLNAILPSHFKGDGKLHDRLKTPSLREAAGRDIERWFLDRQPPDKIVLVAPQHEGVRTGSTLAGAARELGFPNAVEATLRLLELDPAGTGGLVVYRDMMDARHIDTLSDMECTAWASDSVPDDTGAPTNHPRCFGTFAKALSRAAKRGDRAFASATRRATSLPADRLGLSDRGRITPGAAADLVLLESALFESNATYESPGHYPTGIVGVWVNGRLGFQQGVVTETCRGKILTRAA
jgi:N-acyl-D-amino-acid deacylase